MSLTAHLVFDGRCAEAFAFYAELFGGRVEFQMSWGASPAADTVPGNFRDKIVHASLRVGGVEMVGADVPPEQYARPQGFYVLMRAGDAAAAEKIFATLAEGGEVKMPLGQTFWSPRFGVVVDRYAIPWEITV